MLTTLHKGDKVLISRNCHKSVYHGLEIQDLKAYYLNVPFDDGFGICGSILPETAAQGGSVKKKPDANDGGRPRKEALPVHTRPAADYRAGSVTFQGRPYEGGV